MLLEQDVSKHKFPKGKNIKRKILSEVKYMEKILNLIQAANDATTQKDKTPFNVEVKNNAVTVYCVALCGSWFDTCSLFEIVKRDDGKVSVWAGFDSEHDDGSEELFSGPIQDFFVKCPLAKPENNDQNNLVVVELDELQDVLEWAFREIWNIEYHRYGERTVTRAWMP